MHRSTFLLFVAAAFAPACSSSDFQVAGDSAPSDTATTDDGATTDAPIDSGDATKACVVPPSATGTEADFCNALADYESSCGHCEACVQQNENNCISFGQGISDILKRAFVGCHTKLTCSGSWGDWLKDPCIIDALSTGSLSEKQKEAKDAYCAACPANKFECDHFFGGGGDAGPDAGTDGTGVYVLLSNDDAVQKMIDGCTGGANCNPTLYLICTVVQFCGPIPSDACGSKFCNK